MFKKIKEDAKLPTKATKFSAGVDVYANEDCVICAGETAIVRLGIAIDLEMNAIDYNFIRYTDAEKNRVKNNFMASHYIQLMLRSSLGKKGLIIPNGVGTIDLDYKDEIKMIIHSPIISANNTTVAVKSDTVSITPNLNGIGDGVEGRYSIKKGERIGQLILLEHKSYLFGIESEEERTGGFGSTGN